MSLEQQLNPPAIIGEAVAGQQSRAQAIHQELVRLNAVVENSTFDIAEKLADVKIEALHVPLGFQKFDDYVEQSFEMKARKARYLIRIVTVSKALGIPRAVYETVKITKLRDIFSLEPGDFFFNAETQKNEPMGDHIKRLLHESSNMTLEQVVAEVKRLKGLTGDDELVFETLCYKRIVKDSVIEPARELARMRLGSSGKDPEGDAVEYSNGAVEECIHADFLSDPHNAIEEQPTEENDGTPLQKL